MTRILIVEDNRNLATGLQTNLECEGYETDVARDGSSGLARARTGLYDLILLDLMLPGMDGYRVLDGLREADTETPVIILTARGDEDDKVRGLGLGADDYVTKPFGLRELLARIVAQLRRVHHGDSGEDFPDGEPLGFGPIDIDQSTHAVRRSGVPVALRPKEYDLLLTLLRHSSRVATRLELMQEVWGYHESVNSRTLDTHIAELRRKLEDDPANPRWILTVRKTGYRLNQDG
jgi:two-component system alkaline phosphatase synthesis response regulator PhoP